MKVKTISSDIETNYKFKIEVCIANIDNKYTLEDGQPYLARNYFFRMSMKDGNRFKGRILFTDQKNSKKVYVLAKKGFEVQDININYDFNINDIHKNGTLIGRKIKFVDSEYLYQGSSIELDDIQGKFATFQGTLEFEFKPSYGMARKQELKCLLYQETFGSNTMNHDFIMLSEGKEIKFNKLTLCTASKVFQKMIETSNTQEATTGCVEIVDFSPEVIESFKKVVFEDKRLDVKDLTVELLMFGNKYAIESLVKVVADHLSNNLSMENIYAVIEAAYLIDDDDLLKACAKFVRENHGKFENNEKWDQFQKLHPKCFVKIVNFIMMKED